MKSLILIAHGSRLATSNDEVRTLAQSLAKRLGNRYQSVNHGFLELAKPSIPDSIQTCIDQGATDILLLPYFLSAGRHVTRDIPAAVKIKQDEYPNINMQITTYLGGTEGVVDLLLELIEK